VAIFKPRSEETLAVEPGKSLYALRDDGMNEMLYSIFYEIEAVMV
jgi:hypothetical protein